MFILLRALNGPRCHDPFATHARAQLGRTALMWAVIKGHADCARLLLDAGADTKAKDRVRVPVRRVCDCAL